LSDFHAVGGGYDAKASAFDKMSIPRKASGGARANAVQTPTAPTSPKLDSSPALQHGRKIGGLRIFNPFLE